MDTDNTFLGAYLKVNRAKEHIDELISLTTPLDPKLFDFGWFPSANLPCGVHLENVAPNSDNCLKELAFYPKYPIRYCLALVIGDAVHNLRAALDFAATAICRARTIDVEHVHFPFAEERENLVPRQSTGMKRIQSAMPNANIEAFFQDTIKPCKDGNTALWTITKIDKIDKHNFIVPTVTIVEIAQTRNIITEGIDVGMGTMRQELDRPFAFVRTRVLNDYAPDYNVDISVEIAFPEGKFFSGKPVIPTLVNLCKIVTETLKSFEELAVSAGVYTKMVAH